MIDMDGVALASTIARDALSHFLFVLALSAW
jgi:hypothetical protein